MDFEHLKVKPLEDNSSILLLEFEHGKANEVGTAVLAELDRLSDWIEKSVGLTGLISFSRRTSRRGTPIFISGANVTERSGWSERDVRQHVRRQRAILDRFRRLPVFHVCVVNGVALGWGTEFLLTADYKLSCTEAIFGLPETGLGILPGAGGTSELAQIIGVSHTLRLGMTGERIQADEAHKIGLVQEIVSDVDSGLERAQALCNLVAKKSPTAIASFKKAVLGGLGQSYAQRAELEACAYEACLSSGDAAIGRASFDAIRKGDVPVWGPRQG